MSIVTSNIAKQFGKQKALDQVSISANRGELVGFLGPNGAGKSTLMKIISGYLPADSGEVFVEGLNVSPASLEAKRVIGYLPEHNPLYTDLYVKESLNLTAGIYKLSKQKERVAEMIERTGLGDEQHKKIKNLSKGYRQRVGLAQALIHDPSVLILDEPTTGLDPNQLEEIRGLIREISKAKTVLLSSHIMQEVEAVCNRIIIINKGKIIADGEINAVKEGSLISQQIVVAEFDIEITEEAILSVEGVQSAVKQGNSWEITAAGSSDIRMAVFDFAVNNQLKMLTLREKQQNLEQVFQQLTQKENQNF